MFGNPAVVLVPITIRLDFLKFLDTRFGLNARRVTEPLMARHWKYLNT